MDAGMRWWHCYLLSCSAALPALSQDELSLLMHNSGMHLQEKADQRADAAAFCEQNGLAHSPQGFLSTLPVFTVLLRLRQACIHSSLLPPELQLGLPNSSSGSSSSTSEDGDEETAEGGPAELKTTASLTEALSRMQGKRVQSTKLKRVLRIIKVHSDLWLLTTGDGALHSVWLQL